MQKGPFRTRETEKRIRRMQKEPFRTQEAEKRIRRMQKGPFRTREAEKRGHGVQKGRFAHEKRYGLIRDTALIDTAPPAATKLERVQRFFSQKTQ